MDTFLFHLICILVSFLDLCILALLVGFGLIFIREVSSSDMWEKLKSYCQQRQSLHDAKPNKSHGDSVDDAPEHGAQGLGLRDIVGATIAARKELGSVDEHAVKSRCDSRQNSAAGAVVGGDERPANIVFVVTAAAQ